MGSEKTFNKGAPPFQIFQELISTRNRRLVHFKPRKEIHYSEQPGKLPYFSDLVSSVSTAEKYMGCIEEMIKELSRLTFGKTSIPSFLSRVQYTSEVWKKVETQYESRQGKT